MTIGPIPPHPGLIRDQRGGPAIMRVPAPDAPIGDADGFARALVTVAADPPTQCFGGTPMRTTVERFNEHGFFANAGAVAGPVAGPSVSTETAAGVDACHPGGHAEPPLAPIDPAALGDVPGLPPLLPGVVGMPGTRCAASPDMPAAPIGLTGLVVAAPNVTATPLCPPVGPIAGPASDGPPIGPVRPAKPYQPAHVSAKIPVSAVIAAGDDAAAVTISAHGLNAREVQALRADIVALLRRHGLTLDDLRLNGRPLGQGRHDRTGN